MNGAGIGVGGMNNEYGQNDYVTHLHTQARELERALYRARTTAEAEALAEQLRDVHAAIAAMVFCD